MANIHGVNEDNDRPIPNPWGGGRGNDHPQGQSISGQRADNPWRTEQAQPKAQQSAQPNQARPEGNGYAPGRSNIHTLGDYDDRPGDQQGRQQQQQMIYKDLIWSNNLPEDEPMGFCDLCCISCGCGCFVGPCCSENRKSDWCKVFQMFSFWVMIAHLIVFIIEVSLGGFGNGSLGPNIDTLIAMGAKSGKLIKCKYHIHRLLTPVILHAGVMHILMNLYFEFMIMFRHEPQFGFWQEIVAFAVADLYGNVMSICLYAKKISVGASGALMGIYGYYIIWIFVNWKTFNVQQKVQYAMNVVVFFIINLFMGLFHEAIDLGAHLGGLLSGLGIGLLIMHQHKLAKIIGIGILVVSLVVPLFVWIFAIKYDCSQF